ncbi:MAG TPA: trypsin-like peptidase domain-containing protein [Kofleriaceae bacterium]|nr:trypsin-like peptidase domain-containing protein [Kofleriaceae bacterium]
MSTSAGTNEPPSLDLTVSLPDLTGAAVARVAASVVRVPRRRGGGSGLAWSDDLVITSSFHAADESIVAVPSADGTLAERRAAVVGRDPGTDVAVLRVDGGGLTPASFREIEGLAAGQLTFAVARPGRAIRASLRAIGVVGPETRTPAGGRLERWIESDRALPRGFAGGALIDLRGAVIGMNTRTLIAGADLAVPTATLRKVVDALVAHGRVLRGYLGVGAFPARLPDALAPGRGRGALVASVEEGGPAAAAGVVVGDVIVALDGEPVIGPDDLRLALVDRAGAEITVDLVRGGAPLAVTVTVGTRP